MAESGGRNQGTVASTSTSQPVQVASTRSSSETEIEIANHDPVNQDEAQENGNNIEMMDLTKPSINPRNSQSEDNHQSSSSPPLPGSIAAPSPSTTYNIPQQGLNLATPTYLAPDTTFRIQRNGQIEVENMVGNEAAAVRRNMLRASWAGFGALGRGRRYVLIFRIAMALAQVAAGLTVLALPTSLGDSFARPEICDPEGMFVFLTLHIIRVAVCIPIDIYLGLSPHRNARARRDGAQGQLERERNRLVGNLILDRKLSRLSDLFGFIHVVLFVVGNYLVYSSTECSKPPADSIALFWTSFSMLAISYLVILEIALLVFAVVFFLPGLVMILRALGLGGALVNPGINPETGRIGVDKVDQLKLFYYTPEIDADGKEATLEEEKDEVESRKQRTRSSLQELRISTAENAWKSRLGSYGDQSREGERVLKIASGIPLPIEASTETALPSTNPSASEPIPSTPTSKSGASSTNPTPPPPRTKRFFWNRKLTDPQVSSTPLSSSPSIPSKCSTPTTTEDGLSIEHSYPFLSLPSHRSTCPICLEDYKTPSTNKKDLDEEGAELEPLRLLPCNHALHKSCVDQWLTTVSGRCPICQKPVLKDEDGEREEVENA